MRFLSAADLDRLLDATSLCDRLQAAFAGGFVAPPRHHHEVGSAGSAVHLLMPAWTGGAPEPGGFLGTKIVNVFRDNARHGLPAVLGTYLLQSGETGAPLAVMDGTRLTHWRTASASALASRFLSRPDARRLLMVGAGALAPFLIRAHAAVRPLEHVVIWNRRPAGAEALAASFTDAPFTVSVAGDLEQAVQAADIVSCATLSQEPIVRGAWLRPGQHVDLVGAFTMAMREADDEALRRAQVFIDTDDATHEGGDVAIALHEGLLQRSDIEATLADLCRGKHPGRRNAEAVTLFKSTGSAMEDLAAAMLAYERASA